MRLLALSFGYIHVDDMLAELTGSELSDWWSYYQVEPWGPQRDDGRVIYQTGLIGSLFGGQMDSALAVPQFVADIYGARKPSPEMHAALEKIRASR